MKDKDEIARLKGLLGRYAKHMAHTAAPIVEPDDPRSAFHETSPWVTYEELDEIRSYL